MELCKSVRTILQNLHFHGYEAYLVGGAVRNHLLGLPNDDYDVTTSADPEAIKKVFEGYSFYDVGKKHGTVTVLVDGDKIDITPFRKESDYHDHRHPEKVSFSADLLEDLERRDFTINAMCLDYEGKIIDPFQGLDDLKHHLIRTVNDPEQRFSEDALRILRALRFKAKLDFTIEEKTDDAIHRLKDLLTYISNERKRMELLQILSCPTAFRIINEYLDVFNTFMHITEIDRKINDFSDPLYALAYILKDNDDNQLKELKYSSYEIGLVNTLIKASHTDISDDYDFISVLSTEHQQETLKYLEEYHHLDLKERYETRKEYMVAIDSLDLDGKIIESYGYKGKEIGKIKKELVELIRHQELRNESSALQNYLATIQ